MTKQQHIFFLCRVHALQCGSQASFPVCVFLFLLQATATMLCGFLFILYWLAMTISAAKDDWTCFSTAGLKSPSRSQSTSSCFSLYFRVWRQTWGKRLKKKTQPNLFGCLNKENNKQLKTVIKLAVCPRTREVSKFLCFTGECVIVRDCLCAHVRVWAESQSPRDYCSQL